MGTELLEGEERSPLWVHCGECKHEWVALWFPLTMNKRGKQILKSAGSAPCPMCHGPKVFVGKPKPVEPPSHTHKFLSAYPDSFAA